MPIMRKPSWFKNQIPTGSNFVQLRDTIVQNNLKTICQSGLCPNKGECWNVGTATFMILGDICTRACKFCAVKTGKPLPVDTKEPERIADSIEKLKIKHCVITSVDRDDLDDGGAEIWAETIKLIKERTPDVTIEALIPDFNGNTNLIDLVIQSKPEIISHNLETVRRLTPKVRSRAKYDISLNVLHHIANSGTRAKSGIMLGLGELPEEIIHTMDDLRAVNVDVFTIGQYLQPSQNHHPIIEFIHPDIFKEYELLGMEKGFKFVESGPLVRSSYHAEKHIK